ncbi:MAG: tyrosine-protein kinase [Frankiaceae bacterium]|nr:tyrosine-protein kinase [Frankiaceae bacterium]
MDLAAYLGILRKHWRLVVVVTLLSILAAAAMTVRATPQYQSSVKFFVSTPATSTDNQAAYTGGLFSQQRVKSYTDLLTGERLAEAVRKDLNLPLTIDQISQKISANVEPDTVLLSATVTDADPKLARDIATALGRQFPLLVSNLERPTAGGPANVRVVVVADPRLGTVPVSPRPLRNLTLAALAGLLLGVALAVARDTLDNTVKTPEDVLEIAGLATLASIGYDGRASSRPLVVHDDPNTPRAEAFRQLRTNLQFVEIDRPLRSLVVTSPLPGEGKSTSACNLAITLAQAGIRVLLVEGDLRRPKIPDYLGIEGAVGLTSVLIGQVELADAIQPWGDSGLAVLSSGPLPPNPSELLASAGMRALMAQMEQAYDVVVVDAPPLLPVTDAAVIATLTSGAILCVRVGKVRREQVRRAMEALAAVDAAVLGCVLTMAPTRGRGSYAYGYGYGYDTKDSSKPILRGELATAAVRRATTSLAGNHRAAGEPAGQTINLPPAAPSRVPAREPMRDPISEAPPPAEPPFEPGLSHYEPRSPATAPANGGLPGYERSS